MHSFVAIFRPKARKSAACAASPSGNEGVALIVVLGFLSILLVMGMAFMLNARTERIVSDYSLEAIKSRQLMRTALAAAQNDYSRELWRAKYYIPPSWDEDDEHAVFTSYSTGGGGSAEKTLGDSGIHLLDGEAGVWVPAKYHTKAVTNAVKDAEWIMVRESGNNSRILGRYAYVCFDTSGCLDANFIARAPGVAKEDSRDVTNRLRYSVRDVPMGLLPETADGSEFKTQREGWKGFDSLQTLVLLTDGHANDGTENNAAKRWADERHEYGVGLFSNKVSELNCYSLNAYRGGRYDRGSGKWKLPTLIDPETGAGAEEALTHFSGLTVRSDDFERQMKDFVSSDTAPQGVDYPSVKNVPMFNEIILKDLDLKKKRIEATEENPESYEYSADITVQIEFWYPFPSAHDVISETFTLEAPTLSMQSKRDSSKQIQLLVGLVSSRNISVEMESCTPNPASQTIEANWNSGKPYTVSFDYTVKFKTVSGDKIYDKDVQLLWRNGWRVGGEDSITLKIGTRPADKMPASLQCDEPKLLTVKVGDKAGSYSLEVSDPRWNHDKGKWEPPETPSPNDFNHVVKKQRTPAQIDDGLLMYCRNGPLQSPADVGFFPGSQPWTTLDILTLNGAEFLAMNTCDTNAYKTIEDGASAFYTNATFNINSRNTNAVASCFYQMGCTAIPATAVESLETWEDPAENYPSSGKPANWITEDVARGLAERIVKYTKTSPCMSAMDWIDAPEVVPFLKAQGFSKHQREAVVRNTWGLFGVADNLFTAVLIAQSIKEGPDRVGTWDDEDMVTGERRGVALVWRDPFKTGSNLHHEMLVRMFRFLND